MNKTVAKLAIIISMLVTTCLYAAINDHPFVGKWKSTFVQTPGIQFTTVYTYSSDGIYMWQAEGGNGHLTTIVKGTWHIDNDKLYETVAWGAGPEYNNGHSFYESQVGITWVSQLKWINNNTVAVTSEGEINSTESPSNSDIDIFHRI